MKTTNKVLLSCIAASLLVSNAYSIIIPKNYVLDDLNTTGYSLNLDDNLTITSNGSIEIIENNATDRIGIDGITRNNTIINDGLISVNVDNKKVDDDNIHFLSLGINLGDDIIITNTSTISVVANSDNNATNIRISSTAIESGDNTTITNSGSITAAGNNKTTSDNNSVDSIGIDVQDNANIKNSGTISSSAIVKNNGTDGYAYSIGIVSYKNSNILNSGTISSVTNNEGNESNGLNASVVMDNNSTLTNFGTITSLGAINGAYSRLTDYGIETGSDVSIINSGTIAIVGTVNGNAGHIKSSAIEAGDANAIITNSGTITATSTVDGNDGGIENFGILADDNTTITNSGMITAMGTIHGYDSEIENFGILAKDNAIITNSGTIRTTAIADGNISEAISVGIVAWENSTIINYGTIIATAISKDENMSISIGIATIDGKASVTNYGTMTADIAFYSNGSNDTVTNAGLVNAALISTPESNLTNSGTINLAYKKGATELGDFQHSVIGNFIQTASGILNIDVTHVEGEKLLYPDINVDSSATLADGSTIGIGLSAESQKYLLDINSTIGDIINANNIDANVSKINVVDNSPIFNFKASLNDDNTSLSVNASVVAELAAEDTPEATLLLPTFMSNSLTTFNGIVSNRQSATRGMNSGDAAFADRNIWFKPFGMYTTQNDKGDKAGYNANTYGVGLGIDGEYTDEKRAGFAFFYSNSNLDVNNLAQSSDIDAFNFIVYGSNPLIDDKTTLFYQAGYGFQKNSSKRYVTSVASTASADFTSKSYFLQAKITRDLKMDSKTTFIPAIKTAYRFFQTPAYNETGAGSLNNMRVASSDFSQLLLGVSTDLDYKVGDDTSLISNVGFTYDFNNERPDADVSFDATPNILFYTTGIKNSALSYQAGLGLSQEFMKNLTANIKYDLSGRGSDFMNHFLSAKFNWKF